MEAYAGIDLHSSNSFLAVIDEVDRKLFGERPPNKLDSVMSTSSPFEGC
ncbi:MAG: hypothetical protein JRJ29_13135 [Deltaproteobacteria bacterium]|nr:hypothetical protein [Deltaproteobacteria bacterium]